MIRLFILSIYFAFLFGCTASGQKFTKLNDKKLDKGTVYFYRLEKFEAGLNSVKFMLNNNGPYTLSNGSHFSIELEPGDYILSPFTCLFCIDFENSYQIKITPNSYTFIKFALSKYYKTGFVKGGQIDSAWMGFEVVPMETAVGEMKDPSYEYWK